MTVWRYTAVPRGGLDSGRQRGEIAASSAAEVRASLRRVGLQVVRVRAVGGARAAAARRQRSDEGRAALRPSLLANVHRYLRRRRRQERAELYDSLATMLASGLPLLEAAETVIGSTRGRRSSMRSMLVQVREALRSGHSLGSAMEDHPSWFDATEVAMVRAAQHGGTLPEVLAALAERHEQSDDLTNRLLGALTYPAIVAAVGLGVVVFLSVKTLPQLVQILAASGIETPALTARVMALGRFLAGGWWAIALAIPLAVVVFQAVREMIARRGVEPPSWFVALTPRLLRRMAVARVSIQLAELVRTGVPIVEALRVLAPTLSSATLRRRLVSAAERAERGEELSAALDDETWFDPEFRRLLDIGQSSGELDDLLERIGRRYSRQASRLIDRLATLLEPAVIVVLAFLVGTVVMAALLPLLRIREVI